MADSPFVTIGDRVVHPGCRQYATLKHLSASTRLDGAMSQKAVVFVFNLTESKQQCKAITLSSWVLLETKRYGAGTYLYCSEVASPFLSQAVSSRCFEPSVQCSLRLKLLTSSLWREQTASLVFLILSSFLLFESLLPGFQRRQRTTNGIQTCRMRLERWKESIGRSAVLVERCCFPQFTKHTLSHYLKWRSRQRRGRLWDVVFLSSPNTLRHYLKWRSRQRRGRLWDVVFLSSPNRHCASN
jgi:hypothetical protein